MARIIAIHGVAKQFLGAASLHRTWYPALADGVSLAGGALTPGDLACVAYGDIFRKPERTLSAGLPELTADDVEKGFELDLLYLWWEDAARTDPAVRPPDARTLNAATRSAQRALAALLSSPRFAAVGEKALVFSLKQVRRYFTELDVRPTARHRLEALVTEDTRVVIAHSLGSVVAYEALCAHPEWKITTLVTLGSPLGIRNLIFDRLWPSPRRDPEDGKLTAHWPGGVTSWTNISDENDPVALVKDLRPLFGDRITNVIVDNGGNMHDAHRYLTAKATGVAILP
ncbi:hypothetical protein ACTMTF_07235 [Nonomuraea sp. ZG12]|uniref:hypothetical protein n=1 Tax=Nonomuraea sp. ZG12 TaxID=3452207 RepID=UPI003F88CFCC